MICVCVNPSPCFEVYFFFLGAAFFGAAFLVAGFLAMVFPFLQI